MVHFFRKPHFLDKNISCKTSEHHIYCFLTLFFQISAILPRFIFRGMYFQENKFTTRIWFSNSQKPTKLTKPYQKPRKLHYYIKRTDSNSPHNTAFSKINIHKYHFWTVFLFWIHLLHLDQTQVFKFLLMSSDDFLLLLFSSKVRSQLWFIYCLVQYQPIKWVLTSLFQQVSTFFYNWAKVHCKPSMPYLKSN